MYKVISKSIMSICKDIKTDSVHLGEEYHKVIELICTYMEETTINNDRHYYSYLTWLRDFIYFKKLLLY